ncbi:response regulator [Bacillus gobiensis]|uniref:response regulator transcription factor n=1 Tax=Bacillus gobiensis TaxID=1441095 RepID=UPI003D1E3BAA
MYRVVIVDDEPISRNGIEAYIDWEKEGMSVEAICANGEAALNTIKNRSVDILITDILMPVMNGIELMKQAFELEPNLKVIMLSSYSDFEYVREGLKLGAVDYMLKSALEPEDLLAVLHRCIYMLEEERRKEAEFYHYQHEAIYKERKYIEQEIKRLMVQEQFSHSSMDWAPAWLKQHRYACIYLTLDRVNELRENQGYLHVQLLLEELQEMFYEQVDEGCAMLSGERSLFILIPESVRNWGLRLLRLKRFVETELDISISAGYKIEQGISRVLKGLFDSRTACQRKFFEGLGRIYRWKGPSLNEETKKPETEPPDWDPFFEIIRNGDPVHTAVEFASNHWKNKRLEPEQIKQEAYELFNDMNKLQGESGQLLSEQLVLLERSETLEEITLLLKCGLEEIERTFIPRLPDNGNGGQLITKALDYIADHYKENVTLQSVADTVHVSKNYFSILFKKQTGYNFIDYLMEMRIREAKRLLIEENSRIYDVAETAGFNSVKYFNKLFKKMTGLTPLEYREKHKEAGSYIV